MSVTARTYIVPRSQGCGLDQTWKGRMENHHVSGVTWAAVKRRWDRGGGRREVSGPVLLGLPGKLGDQQLGNISAMWYLTRGSLLQALESQSAF